MKKQIASIAPSEVYAKMNFRWKERWAFPLEALKDRYVTRMGGVSYDLQPGELGVNAKALECNTSLVTQRDRVVVSAESTPPGLPAGRTGETFTVVALGEDRSDALRLSPHGEVVFSSFEADSCDAHCVVDWLRRGDPVFLNAMLARVGRTGVEFGNRWDYRPARVT